jgi:hypothetical protein
MPSGADVARSSGKLARTALGTTKPRQHKIIGTSGHSSQGSYRELKVSLVIA